MQYSFLGFSVKNIMEFGLDIKDLAILRYFDDFRESGRMNYETVEGEKYYWVSYQSFAKEMPYLGLEKRSIMARMLKLRDLGILNHYTKKEGGTFSYFKLDDKFYELFDNGSSENKSNNKSNSDDDINCNSKVSINDNSKDNNKNYKDNNSYKYDSKNNSQSSNDNEVDYKVNNNYDMQNNGDRNINTGNSNNNSKRNSNSKGNSNSENRNNENSNIDKAKTSSNSYMKNNIHSVFENDYVINELDEEMHFNDEAIYEDDKRVSTKSDIGCVPKCSSKTNLLKDSSTIDTNLYKYIKEANEIVSYLNLNLGTRYKDNNKGTLILINKRINEGYTVDDFKTVVDKKVKTWQNTKFEQYLNPQTLFGDKFEIYLNQNIVKEDKNNKQFIDYREPRKLRFNNFKGRDYDYDDLEKKLLGWA